MSDPAGTQRCIHGEWQPGQTHCIHGTCRERSDCECPCHLGAHPAHWCKCDCTAAFPRDTKDAGNLTYRGRLKAPVVDSVRDDDLHERIAPAIGYTCVCMDEESAKAGCDCYDIGAKADRARILSILEAKRKWHVEHFHAYEVGSTPRMLAGQSAETLRLAIDDLAREGENQDRDADQGAT